MREGRHPPHRRPRRAGLPQQRHERSAGPQAHHLFSKFYSLYLAAVVSLARRESRLQGQHLLRDV